MLVGPLNGQHGAYVVVKLGAPRVAALVIVLRVEQALIIVPVCTLLRQTVVSREEEGYIMSLRIRVASRRRVGTVKCEKNGEGKKEEKRKATPCSKLS